VQKKRKKKTFAVVLATVAKKLIKKKGRPAADILKAQNLP